MEININSKNYVIIAPRQYHLDLLKILRNDKLSNVKLFTKEEVIKQFDGEYSYKAIIETMNYLNVDFNSAKTFVDSLKLLDQECDEKTHQLLSLKNYLIEKKCINYTLYSGYFFKNKDIYVIGYGKNDIELNKIFKKPLFYVDYLRGENRPNVNEFSSVSEELFFVLNYVSKLIDSGVKQENIEFIIDRNKYGTQLNYMCEQFDLPHLLPAVTPLIYLPSVNKILQELDLVGIEEYQINHEFDEDEYVKKVLQIINDYQIQTINNKNNQIEFLKQTLKNITISDNVTQFIKINKDFPILNNDKYYFLIGFNQGAYPTIKKDEDYLPNLTKTKLNLCTTNDLNIVSKNKVIDFITNARNIIITYHLTDNNGQQYPSSLIKELNLKTINPMESKIYSLKEAKRNLAKLNDNYRKYSLDSSLRHSYMALVDIDYLKYSNSFTKLSSYTYQDKRYYSYSKIKSFFQCQFQYYLSNVLKLNEFETTFSQAFGTLCHNVLSRVYENDFDFEIVFNDVLEHSEYKFINSEAIILEKKKVHLKALCDLLIEQLKFMDVKDIMLENTFYCDLNDEVSINGKIDKIMITTDGINDYYSIIDYKTGSEVFDERQVEYGYSMQLPTYALLLKGNNKFNNKELIGFYLQPLGVSDKDVPMEDQKSFYQDTFELVGESLDDLSKLSTFDKTYANSSYIKSLKLIGTGQLAKNAKVFSKDEFAAIIELTKNNFLKADELIKKGEFEINPKMIGSGNKACQYCNFKNICSVEDDDVISIKLPPKGDKK